MVALTPRGVRLAKQQIPQYFDIQRVVWEASGRGRQSGTACYMASTAAPSPQQYVAGDDADSAWLVFGGILVFQMQAGFAMLEAGSVSKTVIDRIMLKNIFDSMVAGLVWWVTGYALAYGADDYSTTGSNGLFGTSGFFYQGKNSSPLTQSAFGKTFGQAFWFHQFAFAGVASTIVSGAVAGRVKFISYILYTVVISGFVYPVVVHSAWSREGRFSPYRNQRLFAGCGVVDFAGSGVVHMTGGVAALAAAAITEARRGRFEHGSKFEKPQKYGTVFKTFGTLILWTGWYAFNSTSTLVITGQGAIAAHVAFTTTIAATSGCLTATLLSRCLWGKHPDPQKPPVNYQFDPAHTLNGILAGLVSITAGCAVVDEWGAALIGAVGAVIYLASSFTLLICPCKKVDDCVDAFPVHGACGAWGVIATGLFATKFYYKRTYDVENNRARDCAGIFYEGDGGTLAAAVVFVIFIACWAGVSMVIFFIVCKRHDALDIAIIAPAPPYIGDVEMVEDQSSHGVDEAKVPL